MLISKHLHDTSLAAGGCRARDFALEVDGYEREFVTIADVRSLAPLRMTA
jgi:hypothetical protein